MNIQWNKVTWYSKAMAVVLGIGILVLGIYIGVLYQRGLDAMEFAGKLQVKQQPIVQKKIESVYGFAQEGNIKNIATGAVELDEWVLIYEKPGAPALMQRLQFTTQSKCVFETLTTLCDTSKLEQGQRVRVMGHIDASGDAIVERLERIRE